MGRHSLTFGACGGLTPALLGKTFFSTRRPALETGGQRPTARCALGRKIVWMTLILRSRVAASRRMSPRYLAHPSRRRLRLLLRVRTEAGKRHCSTICRKSLVGYSIG